MKWTCSKCKEEFNPGPTVCPKCGSDKRKAGVMNGTVNRELSALKKLLNLGVKANSPARRSGPLYPSIERSGPAAGIFGARRLQHEASGKTPRLPETGRGVGVYVRLETFRDPRVDLGQDRPQERDRSAESRRNQEPRRPDRLPRRGPQGNVPRALREPEAGTSPSCSPGMGNRSRGFEKPG